MSESSTPRTDRAEANWGKPGASMVEHARQLERAHAELVAALEETLAEGIGWYDDSTGGDPEVLPWVIKARAALAKARA